MPSNDAILSQGNNPLSNLSGDPDMLESIIGGEHQPILGSDLHVDDVLFKPDLREYTLTHGVDGYRLDRKKDILQHRPNRVAAENGRRLVGRL